ncbi:MAG: MarR family transcriptional regulator [Myxococcales bacterium]|nr:MarR family transcriptional regulator [Myxococcales bacterium]
MVASNQLMPVEAVREASREMVRELGFLQDGAAALGVTHAQCHALIELGRRGTLTPGEIAELLRLDKSTVSRTVAGLEKLGLVAPARVVRGADGRRRPLALTAAGKRRLAELHASAGERVEGALALLDETERREVERGLALYARALRGARVRRAFTVRRIRKKDDTAVAALIREVMPEFGAQGPGFAIMDPEVDAMAAAYAGDRAAYYVIEKEGRIVGAGGFAPLVGGDERTCELRKMYFYPEVRGLGLGALLLDRLIDEARGAGYRTMYLETLENMTQARRLYEKRGFARRKAPCGATGHHGCDAWYERPL